MCRVGLSRSVALTDVLKCHFEPVDVIPVGLNTNSKETLHMLVNEWSDYTILMREKFRAELEAKIGPLPQHKILVCEVGPDIHGYNSQNRAIIIDKVWRWARANLAPYGITETKKG